MRKKILIMTGTLIASSLPILTVVSCGFNDLAGEVKVGNAIYKIDSEGKVEVPDSLKGQFYQALIDQIVENNSEITSTNVGIINAETGAAVTIASAARDGQYIIYNKNSAEKMQPISLNVTFK